MITIDPSTTKGKLINILQTEFGMKAPSGANKTKLLELLAENGAQVVGSVEKPDPEVIGKDVTKRPKYKIIILPEKDNKGAVPVGINGKVTLIQRNKEVIVSEAIYEVIAKNARKIVGEPMEDGAGMMTHEQPAYPVSVLEIIPQ